MKLLAETQVKMEQLADLTMQALLNPDNSELQKQLDSLGKELNLWYNINEDRFYKLKK